MTGAAFCSTFTPTAKFSSTKIRAQVCMGATYFIISPMILFSSSWKLRASCSQSFFASSSSYFSMNKMFRRRSFRTRRLDDEWLDDFDACFLVANCYRDSLAGARTSQAGLSDTISISPHDDPSGLVFLVHKLNIDFSRSEGNPGRQVNIKKPKMFAQPRLI